MELFKGIDVSFADELIRDRREESRRVAGNGILQYARGGEQP